MALTAILGPSKSFLRQISSHSLRLSFFPKALPTVHPSILKTHSFTLVSSQTNPVQKFLLSMASQPKFHPIAPRTQQCFVRLFDTLQKMERRTGEEPVRTLAPVLDRFLRDAPRVLDSLPKPPPKKPPKDPAPAPQAPPPQPESEPAPTYTFSMDTKDVYLKACALFERMYYNVAAEAAQLYQKMESQLAVMEKLTSFVGHLNNSSGDVDWSNDPEMRRRIDEARALGVEIPPGKYQFSAEEIIKLKESVLGRRDSFERLSSMDRLKLQRITQESSQMIEAMSMMLKARESPFRTIINNLSQR